jgi:hypothetical protein
MSKAEATSTNAESKASKFEAEPTKESKLTLEIAAALIEVKKMQEGLILPLSLKDI